MRGSSAFSGADMIIKQYQGYVEEKEYSKDEL